MTAPRSNSFHYVPVLDLPRPPGAPCPALGGTSLPHDVPRHLFLRLRDRMRLHRTDTADFTDAELHEIKEVRRQVYADVSGKLAPDDFARDLRRLSLARECGPCPRRPECGGAWVLASGAGFVDADRPVRQSLGRLTGSVLDVGCGEGVYLDALAGPAALGALRYVGIDPNPERIALLASRHPWARYHVGTLDAFAASAPEERFDHVTFLRSFNHLPDPGAALRRAAGVLRDGGTLLVVDNVAFGLVRSREQASRAEAGPGAFEHYRNDDARAVVAMAPTTLQLVEIHDVGPDTSNQWWVRFERVAA